jgi:hypothetical protein
VPPAFEFPIYVPPFEQPIYTTPIDIIQPAPEATPIYNEGSSSSAARDYFYIPETYSGGGSKSFQEEIWDTQWITYYGSSDYDTIEKFESDQA